MATARLAAGDSGTCFYIPANGFRCPAVPRWSLLPNCAHRDDWPIARVCTKHLGPAIAIASGRCTGHFGGSTVRVTPLTPGAVTRRSNMAPGWSR